MQLVEKKALSYFFHPNLLPLCKFKEIEQSYQLKNGIKEPINMAWPS